MNKEKIILDYLDEVIPNPKCALNYTKDYELLIAIMLSAQTTDKRVNEVTNVLFKKYNSLAKLKDANLEDVIKIIKSLGSFTKKAKAIIEIARILNDTYNGVVPINRNILETFSMVGRKTVNVFLAEYYNIPNIAVDTHVDRVSKRLFLAKEADNVLEVEKKLKRKIPKDRWCKFHLQMVLFGRYHCMARSPKCDVCKLQSICKYYNKTNK